MTDLDAVVIGAGFGGMYALHRLRGMGWSTMVFEAAPDVGGTWYWNAYPGARCDIESLMYNYSFDPELRAEYETKWTRRYAGQPEILAYARHVADRYDLRRDIRFETRVERATWDEDARRWAVETDHGDVVRARFLITAVGCLSAAQIPDVPGLDTFAGEWYHTGRWPHEPVELGGKRVVQIGTGSSGVQSAPVIAQQAAHLTVLQRTPQYVSQAFDHPLTDEKRAEAVARLAQFAAARVGDEGRPRPLWEGLGLKKTFEDDPEEREAYLEGLWTAGGTRVSFAYSDTITDAAANEEVAAFVRRKIRTIVDDPETAERLVPTYAIGTKRPAVGSDYYEMYNRPDVALVDLRADPIERFVPEGVRLRSGALVEADVIVFATGFDALTGPLFGLNLVGAGGRTLREAWAEGPRTFLGIASHGFPNAFFLTGPGSPSVLSNVIASLEQHVDWLVAMLEHFHEQGVDRIEAELADQQRWVQHVADLANQTLFPQTDSWYIGANIPGKPRVFLPYVAGNAIYQTELDAVAEDDYAGFARAKSQPQAVR